MAKKLRIIVPGDDRLEEILLFDEDGIGNDSDKATGRVGSNDLLYKASHHDKQAGFSGGIVGKRHRYFGSSFLCILGLGET